MDDRAPRSLRNEHVAATRRAIVEVARQRFGAEGYAATSVDDIVRDAGVTKGALYHHFENKDQLFEEVVDELEGEIAARGAAAALKAGNDPLAALFRAFSAFLDAAMEPEVQRISLLDAPSVLGAERFDAIVRRHTLLPVAAVLEFAIKEGVVQRVDAEALAELLLGACTHAGMVIARAPDPPRARRVVGKTLKALVYGLAR